MEYKEEVIKNSSRHWSYDGEKIISTKVCRCGKGKIVYLERTYTNEKCLKPAESFNDTVIDCKVCREVNKSYVEFSNIIDKEYVSKFQCVKEDKENILKEIQFYVKDNIHLFAFSSKRDFYNFLKKYDLNIYGAEATFRKKTTGVNLDQLIKNHLYYEYQERNKIKLIMCLYEYSGNEMPISLKSLLGKFKTSDEKQNNMKLELKKMKQNKLEEIRNELENI